MIFLDTHVVVWLYAGLTEKLSDKAIRNIEDHQVLISQMVRFEIQYLHEFGRLTVEPDPILKSLEKSIGLRTSEMNAVRVFDCAIKHVWTRGIFDRMITAEAESLSLPLMTKNSKILNS